MNLEKLRKELHLRAVSLGSQKELADGIGISSQYLSDILRGKRTPGKKVLDWLGLEAKLIYKPKLAARQSKEGVSA